jgi:hypothetical protein
MAKNDSTTVTKRPRKSAEEKALADLNAAIKTRDQAQRKLDKLKETLQPAQSAFDKAQARVLFLSMNPDLPEGAGEAAQETEEEDVESAETPDDASALNGTPVLTEVS